MVGKKILELAPGASDSIEGAAAAGTCILVVESDAHDIELEVRVGSVLLDGTSGPSPIPHCCRSAGCGTCRVEVLAGAELLSEPAADELDVLDICRDDPARVRLACQARVRSAGGRVRVRPLDS
jgi:ferredoxin